MLSVHNTGNSKTDASVFAGFCRSVAKTWPARQAAPLQRRWPHLLRTGSRIKDKPPDRENKTYILQTGLR